MEQSLPSPCSPVLFTAVNTKTEDSDKPVWSVFNQPEHETLGEVPEFPDASIKTSIYSYHSNPFNLKWVTEILWMIKIGDDLSEDQRLRVSALCEEFADTFSLSVSEVYPVDFKMKVAFPRRHHIQDQSQSKTVNATTAGVSLWKTQWIEEGRYHLPNRTQRCQSSKPHSSGPKSSWVRWITTGRIATLYQWPV